MHVTGADPGFQVRGGGAVKNNSAEQREAQQFFVVFRVKNHDFMPKNHIFSNFRGGARRVCLPPGSAPGFHNCL